MKAIKSDPRGAALDERQRALVDYALTLTLEPQAVCEQDLAPLREVELSDTAIHDAAAITAYFNFVNRIASGLGVELEEPAE